MSSLFHARLAREHIQSTPLPGNVADRRAILRGWINLLRRGELAQANEVQLHGEFLTKVFGDVLGYAMRTTASDDGSYQLVAEQVVDSSRKSADGAIGFFGNGRNHMIAPIELKGANQGLDTRKGRSQTPVQQAWEYASRAPESRWILVSNYDETRLYSKARGWDAFEIFKLDSLDSDEGFARFYGLLNPTALLGLEPGAPAPLDTLLDASAIEQETITERLYREYKALRRDLFDDLRRRHSNIPPLELLPLVQTILDRLVFCAFAEDRHLIPRESIARALDTKNPYDPSWSAWKSLCGLFRGIDVGNVQLGLPPLNGGLFRDRPELDDLEVTDEICERFRDLARYDFVESVSVEVLGHIFEQSVSDLEEMRADADSSVVSDTQKKPGKRRAEGVFYTPSLVTRYLVDLTLAEVFREREAAAFDAVYGPGVRQSKARDLKAWEAYRESLRTLRVLDPACGSGAFLIAAFEALEREYDRVNRALARLRGGQVDVFDLTTSLLNENLFGIDLNGESVEISKLSLWLKTARKDKRLTYLDRNIRRGNSVVDDPMVDPFAFDWQAGQTARSFLEPEPPDPQSAAAIDARWREGFDVVLGNPPYVRHELLTSYKEHWKQRFQCYDGVADLFVYFFERGLSVLKPGGRLGFIVSNKWLRAGYAESLRNHLSSRTVIERLVDFGHAPIFPDADAFPCIVAMRKLAKAEAVPKDHEVSITQFPREQLKKADVPTYVAEHAVPLPQIKLDRSAWTLTTGDVDALFQKMRERGVPLKEYAGCKPYRGVLTGCNAAFIVDTATRDRLVREDPRSTEILRKFLRGQDVARWAPEWRGQWMIFARRGIDIDAYPAIKNHLEGFRQQLEPKPRDFTGRDWPGRKPGSYKWYELQDAIDYHEEFSKPKIVYQEIQFHPAYAFDGSGSLTNNKAFFVATDDHWLLGVLNSPLMWWYNWRYLPHMKDDALSPVGEKMLELPIAEPSTYRDAAELLVDRLVETTSEVGAQRAAVLDLLRMQYGIEKPGNALSSMFAITSDDFVREVVKRRPKGTPKLSAAAQRELRQLYEAEVTPLQLRRSAMREDERALSKLVNQAYGLTPAEEALLWETAPPRMPDAR